MALTSLRIVFVAEGTAYIPEVEAMLTEAGIRADLVTLHNHSEYMQQMQQSLPDIVLLCYEHHGFAGMDCLRLHRMLAPRVPLIVIAPAVGEELAVAAMREGACDLVLKHKISSLPQAIRRAIREAAHHHKEDMLSANLSQQHLQDLLSMTPVGVFRCTADKDCFFVNDRYCEITGINFEQAMGTGWIEALHPEDKAYILREWYEKKRVVEETKAIYRCQRPDTGEVVWVLGQSKSEIDTEGRVIGYLGSITDITRLKLTEEALKEKNDYLTKVNKELDNFVYSASHNLRAPLTSLMGLINLLRLESNYPQMQMHICDMMDNSLKKLDRFIRDIISHSRNSRLSLQYQKADVAALIQEVLDEFTLQEEYKKIDVKLKIDEKAPLYTDIERLRIVIRNLLSNSIRYQNRHLSPGIKITVKVTQPEACFQIDDNGIGIKKEHQGRVFEMFYRADEQRSGSGLGLYIAREVVSKMGGSIELQSEPFNGTHVRVILPNNTELQ